MYLAKFGEMTKNFSLRSWRLCGRNFLKVILFNILSVESNYPAIANASV